MENERNIKKKLWMKNKNNNNNNNNNKATKIAY
jgi:hypothetical protein